MESNVLLKPRHSNIYCGEWIKQKVAKILMSSDTFLTPEDILTDLNRNFIYVSRKTVMNSIGEIRRANNQTKHASFAVFTIRKGPNYFYSIQRKKNKKNISATTRYIAIPRCNDVLVDKFYQVKY